MSRHMYRINGRMKYIRNPRAYFNAVKRGRSAYSRYGQRSYGSRYGSGSYGQKSYGSRNYRSYRPRFNRGQSRRGGRYAQS